MDEVISAETPEVTTPDVPDSDPILDSLKEETEDQIVDAVVETPKEEVAEEEIPAEEEPSPKEETPKVDPKEEARRRYQEREAARAERRAKINAQTQQYVEDPDIDAQEQRVRAVEAKQYADTIERTEESLVNDFDRAIANPDLQIFNQDSSDYNPRLYEYAIKTFNDAYIERDQAENPVGLKKSLFEHLKETAELYKDAVNAGQIKQVRDTRKMKSSADSKPAAQPKEVQKDALMEVLMSDD